MKISFCLCLSTLLLTLHAWAQPAPQDNWALDFTFPGASSNGALNTPSGIAFAADGSIVVADTQNHRIQVFNSSGGFLRRFGSQGLGDGQLNQPRGLAITSDGNIVVADSINNRMQIFTAAGVFVRAFGGYGTSDGQLNYPTDVAIFPDGTIAVADTSNYRVQVFSATGAFLRKWGTVGSGPGQFGNVYSLAIDAVGTVYAADNQRVQVFTSAGAFLRQWGSAGTGNGQFQLAHAVEITAQGEVAVADSESHRIQFFTTEGVFLRKWGAQGTGTGQLNAPRAIAALSGGILAVVDSNNHRIQTFDAFGAPVASFGRMGKTLDGFGPETFGIDIDSEGKIYVAQGEDYPDIQVFTPNGQPLDQLKFNLPLPYNFKVGPDDRLYIGGRNGIEIRERTGALVRKIGYGPSGSGDGQFSGTHYMQIAVDTNGDIYLLDEGNARVQVFDANGQYLRKFGEAGDGPGQLSIPMGLALSPGGRVVVTGGNFTNYFTKAGQFLERTPFNSFGNSLLTIGPDGVPYLHSPPGSNPTPGATNILVQGVNHLTGALYTFDAANRRVLVWRRGFRTLGAASPRLVPMPGIRTVAQRPNGYIDIDYSVTDGDSATVATALAAFKGGSTLLREMVMLPGAALVEGTATKVGPAMATGTVHRVTWNPAGSGLASGDLVFEVFARDDRPKLLDMDFITLPTAQPLTISRIPFTHADLRAAWAWLILNGEPGLSRAGDGEIVGPGGTFTSSSGAETQTTAAGRAWLFAKLGVREATSQEVTIARQATSTTTPNRFTPVRGQRMGDRPRALNEWTFDSSDQYGSEAWWVVPTP